MSDREELMALRRMAELEAKASGQSNAQPAQAAQPAGAQQNEIPSRWSLGALFSPQEAYKRQKLSDAGRQVAIDAVMTGAADIGNTLLTPVRWGLNKIEPKQTTVKTLVTSQQQRPDTVMGNIADYFDRSPEAAKSFDKQHEGDLLYTAVKLGTQVAMTAPVGGALGKGVTMLAPRLGSAAPTAMKLASSLKSGGTVLGSPAASTLTGKAADMGLRVLGGGVTGGASAGLVDPNQAVGGAIFGGMLPPAVSMAGTVGNAIKKGVGTATKNVLGLTTGVGAEPISQAFKAGKSGNTAFTSNLKGDVPLTDVLDNAKAGLQAMNAAKTAEYRSGMIPIKGDKTVLSLDGISKAVDDASAVATFKGQVKNESAHTAVEKMRAAVDEWKSLDPSQFHTPEGLDALKQKLGGILETIPFNEKSARLAAGKIYNATKSEIATQAPTYAKVMKGYQDATEQVSEIERALSLGDKASKDTAMRKLQSLMRNNVQTNYGNRLSLANTLEDQGGVELLPALSGQALNSWMPRSLAGQAGSGAAMLMSLHNPMALGALPFQSPRLVGSMAYGAGRVAGGAQRLKDAAARSANLVPYSTEPGGLLAQSLENPMIRNFGLLASQRNP